MLRRAETAAAATPSSAPERLLRFLLGRHGLPIF
jgi:hypothetical protein